MNILDFRTLDPKSSEDITALQELHAQAPNYYEVVHGRPLRCTEAFETLTSVPPGFDPSNKVVLGIYTQDVLIGVAELLKGYPDPHVAYIALLQFSNPNQNRGYGRVALDHIYTLAQKWSCSMIRLAVIETNQRAHSFWLRQGFTECDRKTIQDVTGIAVVMQRPNQSTNDANLTGPDSTACN